MKSSLYVRLLMLVCFCLASFNASAQPSVHGLEKLYFESVNMSGSEQHWIAKYAPELLSDYIRPHDASAEVIARRFSLPALRQEESWAMIEVKRNRGRLSQIWWAFYFDGTRQGVWHFNPDDGQNREGGINKMLAIYHIDSVEDLHCINRIAIKVQADLFQNGGIWQMTGKRIFFKPDNQQNLYFSSVENSYGFFAARDASLTVSTEEKRASMFIEKELKPDADLLYKCGYHDPWKSTGLNTNWKSLSAIAQCIIKNGTVKKKFRPLRVKSFVERGG